MFGCESAATARASRSKRGSASSLLRVAEEDLDGDVALKAPVARPPHLAHPARADPRNDLVRPELRTDVHSEMVSADDADGTEMAISAAPSGAAAASR